MTRTTLTSILLPAAKMSGRFWKDLAKKSPPNPEKPVGGNAKPPLWELGAWF